MVKKLVFLLLCLISVRTIQSCGQSNKSSILGGYYESGIPLYIGYNSQTLIVTGYIEMRSDDSKNHIGCQLFFRGKISTSDTIPIVFYQYSIDPRVTAKGWLIKTGKKLRVQSKSILMPCSNLVDLLAGETVEMKTKAPFLSIGIVKESKQNLFKSPSSGNSLKSYFIKNDPVAVIQEKNEWILVRYLRNKKIEGWIPKRSIW